MSNETYTEKEALNASMGSYGYTVINEGETKTGSFGFIKSWGGTATISAVSVFGDNIPSGDLILGDSLPGIFSSITVTSGKALAANLKKE
jgi:hypothetical protein